MMDAIIYLKNNLADNFTLYFIPLYILGGRPAAVLSAQLLGLDIFILLPVVVLLDTLQIPFFYHVYDTISKRLFVQKLYLRSGKKEERLRRSKLFQWLQLLGSPGVVTITMLPLKGCGMWSGVLLSKLLKLPKQTSYPLMIMGSLFGCLIILGVGEAILQLVNSLFA
ncbi:MAG: small multi-drug export protein [Pseudomonadota bacterium]|uniref:Small multi-drug export protein n=1 Tax=Candidatus Desulfatibia profunda TaxID=2841695 RepID=A0A8J6NV83_9BACT|nr:small multi-drug export protein [Candidatus Desulfatibia profunda]MBL7179818.1 small multi-drug export protein [Desulfobacterales bacterium]